MNLESEQNQQSPSLPLPELSKRVQSDVKASPSNNLLIALLVVGGLALLALSTTLYYQVTKAWEYRVMIVNAEGHSRTGADAAKFASITPSQDELTALGMAGWELSSSTLEMETAFPNFGKEEYVTGIQPNIRPQRLILTFKRANGPLDRMMRGGK